MSRPGIIIGGGIGGLSAAVALQRVGRDVRVYEGAPAFEPVGAGIMMAPNAMQVLESLGLADAVRASGVSLRRLAVSDHHGRAVQAMDGRMVERRWGHPIVAIHRADLHRALLARLDVGILHADRRCMACRDTDDQVVAVFDDGSEARGEFLVGADGLRSVIRQALFPSARLRYSGQTCWRGVVTAQLPQDRSETSNELWGFGRRFGFLPIGAGKVYWYATAKCPAGGVDDGDVRPRLLDEFRDFADPVRALVADTPTSAIVRHDLHYLEPMAQWGRGRMTLLGDAAHAATPDLGQGGAQAVEDAWVLAQELRRDEHPRAGFQRYAGRRRRKASRVILESRRFGRIASLERPLLSLFRNTILRHTPEWLTRPYAAWMFRGPDVQRE